MAATCDCIRYLRAEADRLEKFIKQQSSAYLQIEDRGATSIRIQALRDAADILEYREIEAANGSQARS